MAIRHADTRTMYNFFFKMLIVITQQPVLFGVPGQTTDAQHVSRATVGTEGCLTVYNFYLLFVMGTDTGKWLQG